MQPFSIVVTNSVSDENQYAEKYKQWQVKCEKRKIYCWWGGRGDQTLTEYKFLYMFTPMLKIIGGGGSIS